MLLLLLLFIIVWCGEKIRKEINRDAHQVLVNTIGNTSDVVGCDLVCSTTA